MCIPGYNKKWRE